MATVITKECINCGACEAECPNTAIYAGGAPWQMDGATHPALRDDLFYIVPGKCTECVGFHDHEACAAVCPVDCCVPDPDIPETEEALLARAKALHPGRVFADPPPSRFRNRRGAASVRLKVPQAAVAGEDPRPLPGAADVPARAAILGPLEGPPGKAAKAAGAATHATPGRDVAAGPAAPATTASVAASASSAAPAPVVEPAPAIANAVEPSPAVAPPAGPAPVAPVAGAAVASSAQALPRASVAASTAVREEAPAGAADPPPLRDGFVRGPDASVEADGFDDLLARLRPRARPLSRLPLLGRLFANRPRRERSGTVPHDGFHAGAHESKRERERRYGEVYETEEWPSGIYVRLELPRAIPPSAARDRLGLGDRMPGYDVDLAVIPGAIEVRGRVADPRLRSLCGVSPSFPADFCTRIPVGARIARVDHRCRDHLLEVLAWKEENR